MDIKEKLVSLREKLKHKTSVVPDRVKTGALALFLAAPNVSLSAPKPAPTDEVFPQGMSVNIPQDNNQLEEENVTLSIAELQQLKKENNLDIPVEWLSKITPGSSYGDVSALVQEGFRFYTACGGKRMQHSCSIKQKPKGYCYGAIKHILEQKFQVRKTPYASAYQEKDHLLQQSNFLAVRININDEDKIPQNSFLVIPKCAGHKNGHICWKKDNATYVSDGVEKAGKNFVDNYNGAGDNVYAFIPCDGSITLSREMLQQCPELLAAIGNKQSNQPSTYMAWAYLTQNNNTL